MRYGLAPGIRGGLIAFYDSHRFGRRSSRVLRTAWQPAPTATWWKGNLHTHSLWSDGDDYPEQVVHWYKSRGYNFLAISDHNVLHEGDRFMDTSSRGSEGSRGGGEVLAAYKESASPTG